MEQNQAGAAKMLAGRVGVVGGSEGNAVIKRSSVNI